jgi:predicted lipoprotein with Yx(FWY)xxD motif
MHITVYRSGLAASIAVVAFAAAGCGSASTKSKPVTTQQSASSSGYAYASPVAANSSSTTNKAAPTAKPGGVTVEARSTSLGMILVDSSGRTLYLFRKDKGSSSTCYGACAGAWPPLTTKGAPTAGPGVQASLLGRTMRSDGTTEVTYARHPLYYFAGDSAPGQTNGQGVDASGALWFVLSPSGAAITAR